MTKPDPRAKHRPVYRECPVCRRPPRPWSRFCSAHAAKLRRYGDPEGKALPMRGKRNAFDIQMKVARRYLTQHAENAAVAAAVELARALLDYKADTPIAADLKLQEALNYQRDAGADAGEVVARVVAFYLFSERRPWKSQAAEDCALGRLVCHAVPLRGYRYTAAVYRPAGELARRHLGLFAAALLKRVNADADRVVALKARSAAI